VSANSVDALYWLGRNAERGGNPARSRSYYSKATERFPQTYFGNAAAAQLAKLGPGEESPAEVLEKIPPPPSLRPFDEPIPAAAEDRWTRAQALRAIAFDASAEQELKNAYFATSSPRFLLEARKRLSIKDITAPAWLTPGSSCRTSIPARSTMCLSLHGRRSIRSPTKRRCAARPPKTIRSMFAAGLIRQESTFQADAVSHANAIGLMQVLPKTGKLLAKQLKVRYTKDKLFEPDYNIELGMLYIASLVRQTGALEYAAAAYNAGEDRIAAWKASATTMRSRARRVHSIHGNPRICASGLAQHGSLPDDLWAAGVATQTATGHAR